MRPCASEMRYSCHAMPPMPCHATAPLTSSTCCADGHNSTGRLHAHLCRPAGDLPQTPAHPAGEPHSPAGGSTRQQENSCEQSCASTRAASGIRLAAWVHTEHQFGSFEPLCMARPLAWTSTWVEGVVSAVSSTRPSTRVCSALRNSSGRNVPQAPAPLPAAPCCGLAEPSAPGKSRVQWRSGWPAVPRCATSGSPCATVGEASGVYNCS